MAEQKPTGEERVEVVAKTATLVLIIMGSFLVYSFMTASTITPQTQIGFAVGMFLIFEGSMLTVACNGWLIQRGVRRLYPKKA
jgi:hypothetical protein